MHKDSVFACIIDEKGKKILEKRYGTLTPELELLERQQSQCIKLFEEPAIKHYTVEISLQLPIPVSQQMKSQKALLAIERKLLVIIFNVLSKN